ncbi:MAG: phosphoribosylaminoimidazolesuccinocarboxamide synthase [Ignavibacteriales bacterium]|nr:phosphoribosylaminoimidazolesuccinocarboxamide synthase [Ignavibacteriales bacterium]
MDKVILSTELPDQILSHRGKVRDIYDLGDYFLFISSDRISAFDVIMEQGIPGKGKILNKISKFWFDYTAEIVPNHFITDDVSYYPCSCEKHRDLLDGRSMLVRKVKIIPLECIVRGYISGSAWKDYQLTGTICGAKVKEGLRESDKFDYPVFTPSTKAEIGQHDENISEEQAINLVGEHNYNFIKKAAIEIYLLANEYAETRGIIIADTKMEFGISNNEIIIADELLTPDSSRFWDASKYSPGSQQISYDKQYLRDYLTSIGFNKQPPPPLLPEEVINNTLKKYNEVLTKLTTLKN